MIHQTDSVWTDDENQMITIVRNYQLLERAKQIFRLTNGVLILMEQHVACLAHGLVPALHLSRAIVLIQRLLTRANRSNLVLAHL